MQDNLTPPEGITFVTVRHSIVFRVTGLEAENLTAAQSHCFCDSSHCGSVSTAARSLCDNRAREWAS